ncbi:MAG: hypothetical protein H6636_09245 [Anaerolineales bacterium]|nr:hypothetical protein [Anaerolineales bacterium]
MRSPSWEEVGAGSASGGGISYSNGEAKTPSLAIAPDGTLYTAWADSNSGNFEIYVLAWNGVTWDEVGIGSASGGGISQSAGESYGPSLVIALDGTIYVAWSEWIDNGDDSQVYIRAWHGNSWDEVGDGSATGDGISQTDFSYGPSLAIAPDGRLYVAWGTDNYWNLTAHIYVRAWDGSQWKDIGTDPASGGGITNSTHSWYPSLAIAPDGTPFVAWREFFDWSSDVYVRAWNGSNWVEAGEGSASGGGVSNDYWSSSAPALAIALDGTLYVSWTKCDRGGGNCSIYIRRRDGNSWLEVGEGSASGVGINNGLGSPSFATLILAPDGTPYVSWNDKTIENRGIYILAWNDTSWVEVGVDSASSGGINHTSGFQGTPSLAIAPDGSLYLAWADDSSGKWQIYVRCYAP